MGLVQVSHVAPEPHLHAVINASLTRQPWGPGGGEVGAHRCQGHRAPSRPPAALTLWPHHLVPVSRAGWQAGHPYWVLLWCLSRRQGDLVAPNPSIKSLRCPRLLEGGLFPVLPPRDSCSGERARNSGAVRMRPAVIKGSRANNQRGPERPFPKASQTGN